MKALRDRPSVTLVIDWNGGKTITIPAGTALPDEAGRVYYPLSYLAEKYKDAKVVAVDMPPVYNPATGGNTMSVAAPAIAPGDFSAPVSLLPTPADEGIDSQQAVIGSTPIFPVEMAPIAAKDTVNVVTLHNESSSNKMIGIAALAVVAAAFILGGAVFLKNRGRKKSI